MGGSRITSRALRELFEEAGLLIVCDDDGRERRFTTPEELARLASYRRELNAGETTLAEVLARENVRLDLRGVAYLAHWITPVGPPRRYDTHFFVALAPEGQPATHDANETVADRWLRPSDALAAQLRGEFDMVPPTIKNLEAIAHFSTSHEVLDHARALGPITAISPASLNATGRLSSSSPVMRVLTPPPPERAHILGCSFTNSFATMVVGIPKELSRHEHHQREFDLEINWRDHADRRRRVARWPS